MVRERAKAAVVGAGGALAAMYALLTRAAQTGLFGNHIEVKFSHAIGL